ncbi:hypothetical protein [Flavobacterium soyae]|nr:hypothetical protein [Flavobacterium soyae]
MKNLIIITFLFVGNLLNVQVGIGTTTPGNTLEINSSTTEES